MPIVREKDGLAKSSRNTYLSNEERSAALVLNSSLKTAQKLYEKGERNKDALISSVIAGIKEEPLSNIDYVEIYALPENIWKEENNIKLSNTKVYKQFYFKNDFSDYVLSKNKGIICLHNSWTPSEFKLMSEKEFLEQNCTLVNILKKVLNI